MGGTHLEKNDLCMFDGQRSSSFFLAISVHKCVCTVCVPGVCFYVCASMRVHVHVPPTTENRTPSSGNLFLPFCFRISEDTLHVRRNYN